MPGWDTTENEFRYRVREPGEFARFFSKEFQKEPRIYAVMGVPKNGNASGVQSLRFDAADWKLEDAQTWVEKHSEELSKSEFPEPLAELQKGAARIQGISFDSSKFSRPAVEKWLKEKGFSGSPVEKSGKISLEVEREGSFVPGSLRDLTMPGAVVTVGIPRMAKSALMEKRVPERFSLDASQLKELDNMDVTEITLTRSPALGKMAEFVLVKSTETLGENNYRRTVPMAKIDAAKKQIGAYVLVPNLPDFQGEMVGAEEIEKAAHRFLKNIVEGRQKGKGNGLEHVEFGEIGHPVESFVDREGVHGIRGGWFVTSQVLREDVWKSVESGEIVGYSVGGRTGRKSAEIVLDLPKPDMKKSEVSDANEGILRKFLAWFSERGETAKAETPLPKKEEKDMGVSAFGSLPDQQTMPRVTPETMTVESMEKETKEKEKEAMKLEMLKKLNLTPNQAEEMEKSGVDLEKAYAATEAMMKAIGMNLSMEGLGYTTMKILTAVRDGDFGTWPDGDVYPIKKSAGSKDTPASDIDDVKRKMSEMTEILQKTTAAYEAAQSRLEKLESARGMRKSQRDVDFTPAKPEKKTEEGWGPYDNFDVSVADADALAKSMGLPENQFWSGRRGN